MSHLVCTKILMSYTETGYHPVYININSNHPPNTIRELPKSIRKRLSEFSCNKEIFEKGIPPYTDALKKKVDSKKTWYIHLKTPPIIFLMRNKESARSFGSIHLIRLM